MRREVLTNLDEAVKFPQEGQEADTKPLEPDAPWFDAYQTHCETFCKTEVVSYLEEGE